jgi:adenosylmethionine-8-amino-7-oxononanoate aminotransferase
VPQSRYPAAFPRSFRQSFPRAVRGEGAFIWDSDGQRYLDFSGQAAVNFIGHGVPAIAEAVAAQASQLEFVHSSQFTTAAAEDYAAELLAFAGDHFRGGCVYFTSGGSEAVETALKLARQYQIEIGQSRRYHMLSRTQSYHGSTLGALAVSGNARRRGIYLPMTREFAHVAIPYCYRCVCDGLNGCARCAEACAGELEKAIDLAAGAAAAFILEPVSGATLGAAVPPARYLQGIAEICARAGVLLIADEVMTGMGRTGRNFAVDHWNLAPDILVAAKGLASGYAPLGAVLASEKIVTAIARGSGAFLHGFTYNAHPLSLAAGREVLRYMRKHDLVRAADSASAGTAASHLKSALATLLDHRAVGDVRGIGLLWGIEFVADKTTKAPFPAAWNLAGRVGEAAKKRGLLLYPMQGSVNGHSGDHVLVAPPAVIPQAQMDWAVATLRDVLEQTCPAA